MAVTGNEAVTLDQLKMWGDEKLGEVAGGGGVSVEELGPIDYNYSISLSKYSLIVIIFANVEEPDWGITYSFVLSMTGLEEAGNTVHIGGPDGTEVVNVMSSGKSISLSVTRENWDVVNVIGIKL